MLLLPAKSAFASKDERNITRRAWAGRRRGRRSHPWHRRGDRGARPCRPSARRTRNTTTTPNYRHRSWQW